MKKLRATILMKSVMYSVWFVSIGKFQKMVLKAFFRPCSLMVKYAARIICNCYMQLLYAITVG